MTDTDRHHSELPPMWTRLTPSVWLGVALCVFIAAMGVWVMWERAAAIDAQRRLNAVKEAYDQTWQTNETLTELLPEYDRFLEENRRDADRLASEIVEYQQQLVLLRDKTQHLERISAELARLHDAVERYAASAEAFKTFVQRVEKQLHEAMP